MATDASNNATNAASTADGASGKDEPGKGLEFPCDFPVKAMGKSAASLTVTVVDIVSRHTSVNNDAVRSRPSRGGKYESITVTVSIESRSQLERIYADLTDHDQVLWTL